MPANVLLVVFDTARADAFEPYGAKAGATPTVGQLARRGSALPAAYATCNWTMPSHASMLGGGLPRALGLAKAPGGKALRCGPVVAGLRDRLLPEVLRRAGYATTGVSANAWISERTGFSTGFERFVAVRTGRRARIADRRRRAKLRWAFEALLARVDDGAREAETVLRRALNEGPRRPFFWFVNLVECHSPYMPPRPYNDLKAVERVTVAREARKYLTLRGIWRSCLGGLDVAPDALARMRHLYDRSIRLMDDWLGRLLERLDECGALDDTLVIVTSDHGENFGEGDLMGHAFSLDDRLIRVPLVVAGPGASPRTSTTSLADLPRLVADALDLGDHPWQEQPVPDGIAVAQYGALLGPGDPRLQRSVWKQGLDEERLRGLTESATCATDGRFKFVRQGASERLYDLEADPLEVAAIPLNGGPAPEGIPPGLLERLRAAVRDADAYADTELSDAAPPPAGEAEDLEERLRLLGYL